MHAYEVTPGIYKIFSKVASLKTYSTGYFSKQQNETCFFCGMTLVIYINITLVQCEKTQIILCWLNNAQQSITTLIMFKVECLTCLLE